MKVRKCEKVWTRQRREKRDADVSVSVWREDLDWHASCLSEEKKDPFDFAS